MAISFHCPSCNRRIGVADTAAGKEAKCPYCQHVSRVPGGEPDREPVYEAEKVPPTEEPSAEASPQGPSPYTWSENDSFPPKGGASRHTSSPPPMPTSPSEAIVVSVLVLFCCCQPLGIVTLVFSILGYAAYENNNYKNAENFLGWARNLNYLGIILGIFWNPFLMATFFVSGLG